jgi:predicted GIY-YIG superfamily endonuclease
MERYEKAFAEFDRVLGMVSSAMVREANAEKYERRKKLGLRERAEQASESLSAEQSLDTFDA